MFKLSSCLLFGFIILGAITSIYCDCTFQITGISPLFVKQFGSRKILFKAKTECIYLKKGESIQAHCPTKLLVFRDYYSNLNLASITEFTCLDSGYIGYSEPTDVTIKTTNNERFNIECESETKLSLYESNIRLTNCEKYMNYAIGVSVPGIDDNIVAGMCYNMDTLTLKFVKYIAYPPKNDFLLDKQSSSGQLMLDLSQKLDSLDYYQNFISSHQFEETLSQLRSKNPLVELFDFDFESLLQDNPLREKHNDFSYIFNTIWWRKLRQHNWHYFLEALEQHTKSQKYVVYVGSYGNMTVPTATETCNRNETIVVEANELSVPAPAYIWAYLKPLTADSKQQEVVVIAHNSPYVQSPNSYTFCEDICDEIDWLRKSKFGNLRRMPTIGYTFCCRPEQVAKIIDYFPWEEKQPEHIQVPTQQEVSSTEQEIEYTTFNTMNEIE